MSIRELLVLGTGSQVPSRARNHNGYLLRWDAEGFLFDPGEGTQRQLAFAGSSVSAITRICITHFHGDHCLGLPGIVQRLSLDQVARVHAHFPASGTEFFERLRHASVFHETTEMIQEPVHADGVLATGAFGKLEARRLDHKVEAFGYRLVEPDSHNMVPALLERHGISGPEVGRLGRDGSVRIGEKTVALSEVSAVRRGQKAAFVMDTRLCDAVFALAEDADLLVIESTFLEHDANLAREYGHLTAKQAARVAAESGVRRLVLTHFSQRYEDPTLFRDEAAEVFGGDVVAARDLMRIAVPKHTRPE
ncbi:ribonuclease Z [Saccharomonospora amisosensis]|uniref:Ribonuclease Z n=1 Tax=Saccharomonospora amisosensis TaxID=1128677 RepID=A0A7X5UT90_9PSEU|nr:ribonuclease Z [Saccharomonospora amisosensis]NIJ13788.1 ribonuclease Z [Saccharomonospora amisosensis]